MGVIVLSKVKISSFHTSVRRKVDRTPYGRVLMAVYVRMTNISENRSNPKHHDLLYYILVIVMAAISLLPLIFSRELIALSKLLVVGMVAEYWVSTQ